MKKRTIAILVGMMCLTATSSYAQKKNLVKGIIDATTSKIPAAVSTQVERQVARITLPYTPNAYIPTNTSALSLERMKANAFSPKMDISKLVPIQPTPQYNEVNSALLWAQKSIQTEGGIPKYYAYPSERDTWLSFYRLLLKDYKGELSPEEQIQLRYLFWHTNTSISSVERKLQSWQDRYKYTPTLPDEEKIGYLGVVNKPPYGDSFAEWTLAADVYILQQLYGANLPKRIKNANVLPLEARKQLETKAAFQQLLKREQGSIEKDRANGLFDYYWSKVEIADVVYKDADKLARMVKAFYFYYIDPQLKVFPRAKYLKTNEAGRIYEIPLKRGLFLEVPDPLNLIPITPEEYVVFKADGEYENPHLVKRADVELLTDPTFYDLTK